ncbi:hypothetical protein JCM33374_g249 [Metschnikowia sp. JCM 33374]|nr:hypothetical protein JCM33374_g249 [Metschnikowia sp. JCM 33374]
MKLNKSSDLAQYETIVHVNEKQKLVFKFVINGCTWMIDESYKVEFDENGNQNNYVDAEELIHVPPEAPREASQEVAQEGAQELPQEVRQKFFSKKFPKFSKKLPKFSQKLPKFPGLTKKLHKKPQR